MKELGKDVEGFGLDGTVSSSNFDTYLANTDLDDVVTTLFAGGISRWIRTGGAGDLLVLLRSGDTKTVPAMLAGETIQLACVKVLKTGTTATKITVFY